MRERAGESVNQAMEFWQERTSRLLNQEDSRQICQNACGFFDVLAEWAAAEQRDMGDDGCAVEGSDSPDEGGNQ